MLWIPSPHAPPNNCLLPLRQAEFFLDSLPASCDALAPFRLCSHSQPQSSPWDPTSEARASASRPHPPRWVSRQASQSGECWSALILCVGISPLCPLHPYCCALLHGSKVCPRHSPSPPVKGLPSVWKHFLLHSSLLEVQVPSLLPSLCPFFSPPPHPGTWGGSCPLGSPRSSASAQQAFRRSRSTCRCISDVFLGTKVISMSYSSIILKIS